MLAFPSNPVDQQTYQAETGVTYIYDGIKGYWRAKVNYFNLTESLTRSQLNIYKLTLMRQ